MENQEKILNLTKEESQLILIAIRQAYYQTDLINESKFKILKHTLLFDSNSPEIINLYNKVAQFLGFETRMQDYEEDTNGKQKDTKPN